MKTRITILVFFNHYLSSTLSSTIRLPRGLVSVYYYKGSQVPLRLVLVSRSVLVLSQPSDVSDLVPLHLVLITLLSPMCSCCVTICLSQAYGCGDHYIKTKIPLWQNNKKQPGLSGKGQDCLSHSKLQEAESSMSWKNTSKMPIGELLTETKVITSDHK